MPLSLLLFILLNQLTVKLSHAMNYTNFSIDVSEATPTSNYTLNQNVSRLLNNLLKGYDQHIRPDLGNGPTVVYIDIEVRSMGPISDGDMSYSMDCYFRQSWLDRRLAFQGAMPTMSLSISMLEKIWKPDTYFYNGKHSSLHSITTPNKFVRLTQDGTVLYSSRLTIQAQCPMNLENFPMDTQRCPLKIGSFGYVNTDLIFKWNPKRQVVIAKDMKLSQFDLISTPSGNMTEVWNKGTVSVLAVSFHLQRHMGYFLIEVYAPCTMLVVLSWVSFWINREATADRVALGVMTVLTMTFLGLESRNDLPKVPYCTALDFFVAISFSFIFATIAEFAIVHYYTKVGSGEYYFPPPTSDSSEWSSSEEDDQDDGDQLETGTVPEETTLGGLGTTGMENVENEGHLVDHMHAAILIGRESESRDPQRLTGSTVVESSSQWRVGFRETHNGKPLPAATCSSTGGVSRMSSRRIRQRKRLRKRRRSQHVNQSDCRLNSVSKIDKVSRVLFPVIFTIMNLIYWNTYLGRDT